MNDFLKIFLVLCAVVSAFFFGRNYGEVTIEESAEIKSLKTIGFESQNAQQQLNNFKSKIQKLLDNADFTKPEDALSQLTTLFLTDLSLRISSEKLAQLKEPKKEIPPLIAKDVFQKEKELNDKIEIERKKNAIRNPAQFRTAEDNLLKSISTEEIRRHLKKVEVRKIDSLLEDAPAASYEESQQLFGSYRGSLIDVTNNIYGTLAFDIQANSSIENPIKGSIKFYRNGEEHGAKFFETNWLGFKGSGSQAFIVEFETDYLQIYKIENSQKIAGIYYDRLPNGTSKTIGTFVLSRIDFLD